MRYLKLMALLLTCVLAGTWLCGCKKEPRHTVIFNYPASTEPLVNPYIGNMTWASDTSAAEQPIMLAYADITWAELEPAEGVYNFPTFEEENNIQYWREQGVHIVLRLVMDVPDEYEHMDIPEWLYEATGDGQFYDIEYGKGYSPNYSNPRLMEAHRNAIAALAEQYDADPLFAYVELGSLGHWGEWHVHSGAGAMPDRETRAEYAAHYADTFTHARLLARRPFDFAAKYGFGLYNDTAGEPESTQRWLDWIAHGGDYENDGNPTSLLPMPNAWLTAPIGGEKSTSMTYDELLRDYKEQTIALFRKSHTSWIGPGSFADVERDGELQSALDETMLNVGYRLRVESVQLSDEGTGNYAATLVWRNDGVAPLYFDWPIVLVVDDGNSVTYMPMDTNVSEIVPGRAVEGKITLKLAQALSEGRKVNVGVAILNPNVLAGEDDAGSEPALTAGPDGVCLAMATAHDGYVYQLFAVE